MIAKKHAKGLLAQLIAVTAVMAVLGVLALAGRIVLYSLSGAKTSQALHEIPEVPEGAEDHVSWLPDRWSGERQLEIGTRRQIEATYAQVWETLSRYPETGDRSQVERWFAGPARQHVLQARPTLRREVWGVHFQPELTFYSMNGTALAMRDQGAVVVRSLKTEQGETVITSLETYDCVFALEDGYWRIRQFRQLSSRPLIEVSSAGLLTDRPGSRPQTLLDQASSRNRRSAVPLTAPVRTVDLPIEWTAPVAAGSDGTPAQPESFDRPQLEADLRASAAAGLTSVRITVPATAFGAVPSAAGLAVVRSALDRAQAHGLRVEVTIDGAGTNRSPSTWNQADNRLATVVAALGDHPALALWNLAQDPEAAPTPDVQMRAWLVRAALKLHTLSPGIPITIGWQSTAAAADPALIDLVDVVTVPWQGDPDQLDGWLSALTRLAGDRSLRLAPTAHSWNSIWPGGQTENQQAGWIAAVVRTATAHRVSNLLTGPLRDSSIPAPSRLPWVAGPRTHTGLLHPDGTAKPVVGAISPVLALRWPAPDPYEDLHKPFWRVAALLVLLSVPGLGPVLRRGIRRLRRGSGDASDLAARQLREEEIQERAEQEVQEARAARKARERVAREGSVDLRESVRVPAGKAPNRVPGSPDGPVEVEERRSIGFTVGWLVGRILGSLSRRVGR